MCSPPTALLEGKNPAQEGKAEGLHEGPDEGAPPILVPCPRGLIVPPVSAQPCRKLPEGSLRSGIASNGFHS